MGTHAAGKWHHKNAHAYDILVYVLAVIAAPFMLIGKLLARGADKLLHGELDPELIEQDTDAMVLQDMVEFSTSLTD